MEDVSPTVQSILSEKHIFVSPNEQQLELLQKCLLQRIADGQGECFLEVGVGEGQEPGLCFADMMASSATITALLQPLHVCPTLLRERCLPMPPKGDRVLLPDCLPVSELPAASSSSAKSGTCPVLNAPAATIQQHNPESADPERVPSRNGSPVVRMTQNTADSPTVPSTSNWLVREYLLRNDTVPHDFVDIRVAVVGNVDAGKSTLLGVLTHDELDNGRGLARLKLFRHKHEAETGRTSSISNDILGFTANGIVVNRSVHGQLDWPSICEASSKVLTFIDLAGHERYLKTTVFGLTGHAPDFVMLMVGANAGVIGMAKEHLGLALALAVPVFVVVTKIDMCPANVLEDTISLLLRILKSPGCRKIPLLIANRDDVVCSATNFTSERMCPVFTVSNVTGENLDLLKYFLNLLTPRAMPNVDEPAEYQIDEMFSVQGIGTVVAGTCLRGIIRLNDVLMLGPDPMGVFHNVTIKSIQRKRMVVTEVRGGQSASFAITRFKRNQIRKGMFLVARHMNPVVCWEFTATVLILHHPTTISVGYQAMVHAGTVRQTATILSLATKERLRTGDKDEVHFRFIKQPEYLRKGLKLVFREGKTKAVGTVSEVTPFVPAAVIAANARSRKAGQNPHNKAPPAQAAARTNEVSTANHSNNVGSTPANVTSTEAALPSKPVAEPVLADVLPTDGVGVCQPLPGSRRKRNRGRRSRPQQ